MSDARAEEFASSAAMREQFANTLARFEGGSVLVAAGACYRRVFGGWLEALAVDERVARVEIAGAPAEIGRMRRAVKAFAVQIAAASGEYADAA
jgi:hypothetical protein